MPTALKTIINKEIDHVILTLEGELDFHHAPDFSDQLNALIDQQNQNRIIVNLEKVTFIDSVGIGAIAIAAKKVSRNEGSLQMVCAPSRIESLLRVAGLVSMIKRSIGLYETLDEARNAVLKKREPVVAK